MVSLLLTGLWSVLTVKRHWRFEPCWPPCCCSNWPCTWSMAKKRLPYSMNFLPLLIALTAFGTLGRQRAWVLVLAGTLTLCAGLNNWQQFRQSVELAHLRHSADHVIRCRRIPGRPWPQVGRAHSTGCSGSSDPNTRITNQEAISVRRRQSFGVSFWLCDTGDALWSLARPCLWPTFNNRSGPSRISGCTRDYLKTALLPRRLLNQARRHTLGLRLKHHSPHQPAILTLGVGPASGPVTELHRDGNESRSNRRWVIRVTPAPPTSRRDGAALKATASSSRLDLEGIRPGAMPLALATDAGNQTQFGSCGGPAVPMEMQHLS